jgi:hypothetical protein
MTKTIKVQAILEMDMEVDTDFIDNSVNEAAVISFQNEIDYNIRRAILTSEDFEYKIVKVYDGSILEGTVKEF